LTLGFAPEFPDIKTKETSTVHEGSLNPSEKKMQTVEQHLNDLSRQQRFFDRRKTRQNEGKDK
jgi:hypothetical protein